MKAKNTLYFDGFIRVFTLVHAKFLVYFNIRIYLFLFYITTFKKCTH